MPLFANKFTPKKTIRRKLDSISSKDLDRDKFSEEFGLEVGPIKLRLGDQEALFDKGLWTPESGPVSGTHKENEKLRHNVQQLQEENYILKLKFEILLDMLTQTTAETHIREKEINLLRNQVDGKMKTPIQSRLRR